MLLTEAAQIIGSLGGRPRLNPLPTVKWQTYRTNRGGFVETTVTGFRLILEDGNGFLLLEDGSYLLLE